MQRYFTLDLIPFGAALHTPIAAPAIAGTVVHVVAGLAGQFGAVDSQSCRCAETPLAVALQISLKLPPLVGVLVQSPLLAKEKGAPKQVVDGIQVTTIDPGKLDHTAAREPVSSSALVKYAVPVTAVHTPTWSSGMPNSVEVA